MVAGLRKIHLYAGWLFVLTFVLTGQYMRYAIHPRMEADPVLRFLLRANHVYILLFGLLQPKVGDARPILVIAMVAAVIGTGLQLLSVRGQRQQ